MKKISKANIEDIFALSPMQEGMLFHYLLQPGNKQYLEQFCYSIRNINHPHLLMEACLEVIRQNEMLRTVFIWRNVKKPIQVVLKEADYRVRLIDLSIMEGKDRQNQLDAWKHKDWEEKVQLEEEPFRITLFVISDSIVEMVVTSHHIVSDGWSNSILLNELFKFYEKLSEEKPIEISTKRSYKEFVIQTLTAPEKRYAYWDDYLQGYETKPVLLHSTPQELVEVGDVQDMSRYVHSLDPELVQKVRGFVSRENITLATLFYCAWGIFLQRYGNMDDIVFGATSSGRNLQIPGIESMMGLFINTIPIRFNWKKNEDILDVMKELDIVLKEHLDFEHTSLAEIQNRMGLKNENLFESVVLVENYPLPKELVTPNDRSPYVEKYSFNEQGSYDLSLYITTFGPIEIHYVFNENKLIPSIDRVAAHLDRIIEQLIQSESISINNIILVDDKERKQLLCDFNSTQQKYEDATILYKLFERQADENPNELALTWEKGHLTYKEMENQANQIARYLMDRGVKGDVLVGVMMDRSPELITAIFGILKAGGAYVPIDPLTPVERATSIVNDAGLGIIISKSLFTKELNKLQQQCTTLHTYLCLDESSGLDENLHQETTSYQYQDYIGEVRRYSIERVDANINPNNLAYVIYTSGSTGKPKGVMIEHGGLTNRIMWMQHTYQIDNNDVLLQKTPVTFDVSVWELFWWSISGASLHILENSAEKDPAILAQTICKYKVSVIHFVPSMFRSFLDYIHLTSCLKKLTPLKRVFTSGEALDVGGVRDFYKLFNNSGTMLTNLYGPTEATIDVTYYDCPPDFNGIRVPIGKPIGNMRAYILDPEMRLQPIGVVGELYVSGIGVARGYLNRTELTKERFILNPVISGQMLYKTGDLARWSPDGNIEYFGRIDHQVKLRGYRIELGEIENILLHYPDITQAAVVVKRDAAGDSFLCAYLVSRDVSMDKIIDHAKCFLPDYMLPSEWINLEAMPLTSNGKIDRKNLIDREHVINRIEWTAPTNNTEQKLIEIWKDILDKRQIGVNENFFNLGGHSLKAITLSSRIFKEMNAEVSVGYIFNYPTISQIATKIIESQEVKHEDIPVLSKQACYPVSSSQKRLYILHQIGELNTSYHISGALKIEGMLDLERLNSTIVGLVQRHESFRTSFGWNGGELVQFIHDEVDFQVQFIDASGTSLDHISKQFIQPFDLSKPSLFRVLIARNTEFVHTLFFDMHHIISDGVSMGILSNEIMQLYHGKPLHNLPIQYKDFSSWQNDAISKRNSGEYWKGRFADGVPVLDLPYDYPRSPDKSFNGDRIVTSLNEEVASKVRRLAHEMESTSYMVLLATYYLLLYRYTGHEDLVIGSPTAGRDHADTHSVIGCFVNMLPIRNKLHGGMTFRALLNEVKVSLIEALEHSDYPYEMMVETLSFERDTGRNPLFDVVFVMQNMDMPEIIVEDCKFTRVPLKNLTSKFDLTLEAVEEDQGTTLEWEFSSSLFECESVQRLANHYVHIIKECMDNPDQMLSQYGLLSGEEIEVLTREFNEKRIEEPVNETIIQLFERRVREHPDNIALIMDNSFLSYDELNSRADRVATWLLRSGLKGNQPVAILLERSYEMIAGMLGVLKAGGAYVPIDPNHPKQRCEYILEDCSATILITTSKLKNRIAFDGKTICLDAEEIQELKTDDVNSPSQSQDIAYIIYTSGTTGNPKGTMVEHRNVVQLLFNRDLPYTFSNMDVWTMFHSYSFDFSVWEMYGALLFGGKLVLVPDEITKDPYRFSILLEKTGVTVLNQTPTAFYQLSEENFSRNQLDLRLRYIIFGGEPLKPSLLLPWKKRYPEVVFVNMYGITETTVHVTYKILSEQDMIRNSNNIGKPLPSATAYVFDSSMNLVPIGVIGELCIGGSGVARGYINREQLTAEKFVPNPYAPQERLYRSGDLARFKKDGTLEYFGRADHQVKIRGFRIELGEIEAGILSHPAIVDAVVVELEHEHGGKYLCAYFVSRENIPLTSIREHLAEILPAYMLPSFFIPIKKIPLTGNGKVNRKLLPEPTEIKLNQTPNRETERVIAQIWSDMLGLSQVDINSNFFDIGGNSILLIQLSRKLEESYPGKISITDIFANPSVSKLATLVRRGEGAVKEKLYLSGLSWSQSIIKTAPQNRFIKQYGMFRTKLNQKFGLKESASDDVEAFDLYLAVLVYLLSTEATDSKVSFYTFTEAKDGLIYVEVDVSQYSNVSVLADAITGLRKFPSYLYPLEDLNGIEAAWEHDHVSILVYRKETGQVDSMVTDAFDILLELDIIQPLKHLLLWYDSLKLDQGYIQKFTERYTKMINRVNSSQE